jgi:hypothetical protein
MDFGVPSTFCGTPPLQGDVAGQRHICASTSGFKTLFQGQFRHSLATALVKLKVDPKTVQGVLRLCGPNCLAVRRDGMRFTDKISHSLNQVKLQLEARFFALLMTLIALSNSFARFTLQTSPSGITIVTTVPVFRVLTIVSFPPMRPARSRIPCNPK